MRGIGRFISGMAILLAISAGAAYYLRAPLAEFLIRRALVSFGIENVSFTVTEISPSRLALEKVSAGRGGSDLNLQSIEFVYDWRRLLSARKVETISIGPGEIAIDVSASGDVAVAGMDVKRRTGTGAGALPFDALAIASLALVVRTPDGEGRGRLSGSVEPAKGGAFLFEGEAGRLAIEGARIENASIKAAVQMQEDGGAAFSGEAAGDVSAALGGVKELRLTAKGEGSSWRDILEGEADAIAGGAEIRILSAKIDPDATPGILALMGGGQGAAPLGEISVTGGVDVQVEAGRLVVEAGTETPLQAVADRGDRLILSAKAGEPFYQSAPSGERVAAAGLLSGPALSGTAEFLAERASGDGWSFSSALDLDAARFAAMSMGPTKTSAAGAIFGASVDADLVVSAVIEKLTIGRLNIADAAVASTLRIRTDLEAKEALIFTHGGDCIALARAKMTIEEQDTALKFSDGRFCRSQGPVMAAHWGTAPAAKAEGEFAASEAALVIGRTEFSGAPPVVTLVATYDGDNRATRAEGRFEGGRILLNDALVGSQSHGIFVFELDPTGMTADMTLSKLRLAQNSRPAMIAPLLVAGAARLNEDKLTFDYQAETSLGAPIGVGAGVHDVLSGEGETQFSSGMLHFAPEGLQPEDIVPTLKGIITDALGEAAFNAIFQWGRNPPDTKSSGSVSFYDLSFLGPGRVVTATNGVAGDLKLDSLWPVATDGVQTISIARLDMDALALDDGEARFELPGDETIRIERAAFPWFGGMLGAYEATASLSGEEAIVPLKAENIDITKLLEFIDIDGLEGEGVLSGVLPLKFENGRARIEGGELRSVGPGAIRYNGQVSNAASQSGQQADVAFSILRDLRYEKLSITIDGPLDGSIDFRMVFEGTGEVPVGRRRARVPVIYRVNIDAALLELLSQANLTRNVELQIQRGLQQSLGQGEPTQ